MLWYVAYVLLPIKGIFLSFDLMHDDKINFIDPGSSHTYTTAQNQNRPPTIYEMCDKPSQVKPARD